MNLQETLENEFPGRALEASLIREFDKKRSPFASRYQKHRAFCVKFCSEYYTPEAKLSNLPPKEIFRELVQNVLQDIQADPKICNSLLAQDVTYEQKESHGVHALKSTYYSIAIGQGLNIPPKSLVELGLAGFIHEIGMRHLPPEMYAKKEPLTREELIEMRNHPQKGAEELKRRAFSQEVTRGVQEHHEREDGSGYPGKLQDQNISIFGKILAVSCAFEAQTSKRNYRKNQSSYEMTFEMLKASNLYDKKAIIALITTFGVIPLNSQVKLESGYEGRIVETFDRTSMEVGVQFQKDPQGNEITEPIVMKTELKGPLSIAKILS